MSLSQDDLKEIQTAQSSALEHGIRLDVIDETAWHFMMTFAPKGEAVWIVEVWPSIEGRQNRERVRHDLQRPGPRLALPRRWTLTDAVNAAIAHVSSDRVEGRVPAGGKRAEWR